MGQRPKTRGSEPLDGGADALVGGGEGDADVPGAGRTIELTGRGEDAERRQVRDRVPARFVPGDPQVERRLRVVNAEAVPLESGAQRSTAARVPLALLIHVRVVVEGDRHRRLHRSRDDHPGVLTYL